MNELNLLIQLDCVLDTRLAVLGAYDPAVTKTILGSKENVKKYRSRLVDDWSDLGVPREKFKELWANRNSDHLRNSVITPIVFELTDIIEQIYDQFRAAPHTINDFKLYINHYPYSDLTEHELKALSDAISVRLKSFTKIEWVCVSPKQFNPIYWKNRNIASAVMYDFEEWIVAHYGEGNEDVIHLHEMPRNTVYVPSLFTDLEKLRETAEYENPHGKRADPLESIQFWLKPYFNLEYLGAEHFCIIEPDLFVAMEVHNAVIRGDD